MIVHFPVTASRQQSLQPQDEFAIQNLPPRLAAQYLCLAYPKQLDMILALSLISRYKLLRNSFTLLQAENEDEEDATA